MKNGDIITGELKTLQYGILQYKTDGMSTLSVKWDHVTQIKSKFKFEVTLNNGGVYLAYIDTTSNLNEINLIINSKVSFIVDVTEVVSISKIKDIFWDKFSGGFSFGLDYTKGSNIFNYDLKADLHYRTFKYDASLRISSNLTNDMTTGSKTEKQDAEFRFDGFLVKRWFYSAFSTAESNSQLGLDLRTSLGGGIGRRILHSYINVLAVSVNMVANRENPTDGEAKNNIEGLLILEYRIFNNAPPKTNLTSKVAVYPSFTEKGRVRGDFEVKGSIEIWNDFNYSLTYYYSADNQPATEGADNVDWGVVTSVGYTF